MVVLLSALIFRRRIDRRTAIALALSYGGIVLVFAHDLDAGTDPRALWIGGALVFTSAVTYSLYLVGAGGVIARLGSMRFISWAMLISAGCVMVQFAATRPLAALAQPPRIHLIAMAMALVSTVLPTLLIAEAIRRIGADRTSLVGSLGPVFTIALGYWILAEPVYAVQLAGAALVLTGVTLVTLRRRSA
jgi:drug/metabolite transporter (DMT)-like permease